MPHERSMCTTGHAGHPPTLLRGRCAGRSSGKGSVWHVAWAGAAAAMGHIVEVPQRLATLLGIPDGLSVHSIVARSSLACRFRLTTMPKHSESMAYYVEGSFGSCLSFFTERLMSADAHFAESVRPDCPLAVRNTSSGVRISGRVQVDVRVVPDVPAAVSATVEPASSDDWELVELHANHMEQQLLNQASRFRWKRFLCHQQETTQRVPFLGYKAPAVGRAGVDVSATAAMSRVPAVLVAAPRKLSCGNSQRARCFVSKCQHIRCHYW